MLTIPIISSIVFIVYTLYIFINFGIIDSYSVSYYYETSKKNYLFIAFIFGIAIPTALLAFSTHLSVLSRVSFFTSGILLFLVCTFASFRDSNPLTSTLHSFGATGGIGVALIGLCLSHIYIPAIIAAVASILLERLKVKNATLWVEIACFVPINIGEYYLPL